MLTQEEIRKLFTYREDGCLIRNRTGKEIIFSKDKHHRYYRIGIRGKTNFVHRIIFLYHHGYLPKGIDHIDGDRYNNRIENLREADQSQNSLNRVSHKNNKSGCKNVYWQKNMNKWCVILTINRKRNTIGYFEDLELADLIASEYRAKYHGEFARN